MKEKNKECLLLKPQIILAFLAALISLAFSLIVYPLLESKFDIDITQDEYDELAWSLAQGKGFRSYHGEESVIRGPGYPAFLAFFYLVFGHVFWPVQVVQSILNGISVYLTFLIGKEIRDRRVGIIAAAIMALNPLLVWYAPRIIIEPLFLMFNLLILLFAIKLAKKYSHNLAIALGVTIALASLTKSFALAYIFLLPLLILVASRDFKRSLISLIMIVLASIVIIMPWTYRNYQISGEVIPVQTSLGLPLVQGLLYVEYASKSPFASEMAMLQTKNKMLEISSPMQAGPVSYPLASLKDEIIIDKLLKNYMIGFYMKNPHRLFIDTGIRSVFFWYYSSNKLFSLFMLAVNFVLVVLALLGIFKGGLSRVDSGLLIWILIYIGLHAVIIASVRFSLNVQPLLMIFGGAYLAYYSPLSKLFDKIFDKLGIPAQSK